MYVLGNAQAASLILPLIPPSARPAAQPHLPDQIRRGLIQALERAGGPEAAAPFLGDPGHSGPAWTISAPPAGRGQSWFRLTVLGRERVRSVTSALAQEPELLHGWRVGRAERWSASWLEELDVLAEDVGAGGGPERIAVHFLSPTRRAETEPRAGTPLPDPVGLLLGWRQRWLGHLDAPAIEWPGASSFRTWLGEHLEIVGVELHTARQRSVRSKLPAPGGSPDAATRRGRYVKPVGFVGRLDLKLVGPDGPERAFARSLARLAFFCGTGKHLAQGFGQTLALIGPTRGVPNDEGVVALLPLHEPLARFDRPPSSKGGGS